MPNPRCAVCKHFRRRCRSDCIFSPYFPPSDLQRFAFVHQIYGAANIEKILKQLPLDYQRAQAVETLYFEAKCRKNDLIYGTAGVIAWLQQEICKAEAELAKTRAEIAFHRFRNNPEEEEKSHQQFPITAADASAAAPPRGNMMDFSLGQMGDAGVGQSSYLLSEFWPY